MEASHRRENGEQICGFPNELLVNLGALAKGMRDHRVASLIDDIKGDGVL